MSNCNTCLYHAVSSNIEPCYSCSQSHQVLVIWTDYKQKPAPPTPPPLSIERLRELKYTIGCIAPWDDVSAEAFNDVLRLIEQEIERMEGK